MHGAMQLVIITTTTKIANIFEMILSRIFLFIFHYLFIQLFLLLKSSIPLDAIFPAAPPIIASATRDIATNIMLVNNWLNISPSLPRVKS